MLQQSVMQGSSGPPPSARRHIVAVIGDSCLDPQQLQLHEVAGDEAYKQQLAEEVGTCCAVPDLTLLMGI
jgi:hypothetical protein